MPTPSLSNMKKLNFNAGIYIFVCLLIIAGAASRLLPHPANFTPITAIALFGGIYLPKKWAFFIPFAVMIISDLFIGFYAWQIMAAVYFSFGIAIVIGSILRAHKKIPALIAGTLSGSFIFFLITNWAVWAFGTMYAKNFSGLMQSYYMALPFFRNSLAGDLFYSAILIAAMEAVMWSVKKNTLIANQP
jgi:hypothetical protein